MVFRKKDKREPAEVYWKKPLVEEKVAVQRLSILVSAKEQPQVKAADEQAKVDSVDGAASDVDVDMEAIDVDLGVTC